MCQAKGVQLDIPPDYFRYLQDRAKQPAGIPEKSSQQVLPENIAQFGGTMGGQPFNPQQAQFLQSLQGQMGFNQPIGTNLGESPKKLPPTQQKMQAPSDQFIGGGMPFGTGEPQFGGNFGQVNPILAGSSQQQGTAQKTPLRLQQKPTTLPTKAVSMPDQKAPSDKVQKPGDSSQGPPSSESLSMVADRELPELSEEIMKKITFALNNCTVSNVDEKVRELLPIIDANNVATWIAKYIAYKRAPTESNLHAMYISLVTKLNKKEMFPMMIKDTINCINIVLASERVANEKTILRNLGSWLGGLTLARNKPIIIADFDVKNLLLDSFENGKLEYVLPMVCKMLSMATQSQVFNINNAWMRSILSLLVEILERPELKMHQKAEITVLFTELKIEPKAIMPSDLINRRLQRKR
mgnify:CR=1 FL=1